MTAAGATKQCFGRGPCGAAKPVQWGRPSATGQGTHRPQEPENREHPSRVSPVTGLHAWLSPGPFTPYPRRAGQGPWHPVLLAPSSPRQPLLPGPQFWGLRSPQQGSSLKQWAQGDKGTPLPPTLGLWGEFLTHHTPNSVAQELPRPAAEWTSTPAVRAPSSGGKQVAGVQTNLTGRWGCAQVTGISRGRVTHARVIGVSRGGGMCAQVTEGWQLAGVG